MKYIDIRAVHRLFGTNYPPGARALANSLETFFGHMSASGDRMADQMLAHNLSGKRNRSLCELAKIDADLMFTYDVLARKLDRDVKDYRKYHQYARPEAERRVVLHLVVNYPDKTRWVIEVPIQATIKGFGDVEDGYQCYSHSIVLTDHLGMPRDQQRYYCGITSRNWLKRMSEHLREIQGGSNKTFHRTWREYRGRSDVMLSSELVVLNQTYQGAMAWEEWIVDRHMAEGRSLNMLPGGFKGLRTLHKLGLLDRIQNVTDEERDEATAEYARKHPKAGIPNLLVAGLWQDDAYYAKVIEGRSNTLSAEQVRKIRSLAAAGRSDEQIAEEVKARTVEQVRRVLKGQTYSRMR